jgi:hypothetical protein
MFKGYAGVHREPLVVAFVVGIERGLGKLRRT